MPYLHAEGRPNGDLLRPLGTAYFFKLNVGEAGRK